MEIVSKTKVYFTGPTEEVRRSRKKYGNSVRTTRQGTGRERRPTFPGNLYELDMILITRVR